MSLMILSTILAMILIAMSLSGCGGSDDDDTQPAPTKTSSAAKKTDDAPKVGSKADVLNSLKKLADADPPKKLQPGAMCYEMAAPPDRLEYVCPTCSEKTLYITPKTGSGMVEFLDRDLGSCRHLVKQVKGLKVSLDESAFCKKCKPNAKKQALTLIVTYNDTKSPNRVSPIDSGDLKLLVAFTQGKLVVSDDYDFESPLKKQIKRLEHLLGVSLEKTK